MLTCQEVTEKASLMVDGELGVRDRMALQIHLMICANCRLFNRQFKALVSSLASRVKSESQTVSLELAHRVRQSLDGAPAPLNLSKQGRE